MTDIPLVDAEDMVSSHNKKKETEKKDKDKNVIGERTERVKKKKEKPIRVIRIKYYDKMSLPFMENGKKVNKEIFAVNRGLEDLLKQLYYNTDIHGIIAPSDCIWVEKDDRVGIGSKFIFIEINKDEFIILKRQLENDTTIYAFNKGEFIITEGTRSYLSETWNVPRIYRSENYERQNYKISDSNKILAMQKLRNELKEELRAYHSRSDEDIDNMSDMELLELKRLAKEKMKLENRRKRSFEEFWR